jgi:tetrahydromethanopterin S-methyltransferase subunit G
MADDYAKFNVRLKDVEKKIAMAGKNWAKSNVAYDKQQAFNAKVEKRLQELEKKTRKL